jgi:hypothetical protein
VTPDRKAVDASLVAEMLRLPPVERLRQNDRAIATIEELHRAFATKRSDDAARRARGHMTDLGPLDVLGAIEGGLSFDELLDDSVTLDLEGHPVRVLSLAAIVRIKRGSTHPKDQQALPVLEEALRQLTERDP